tara:strand:- start:284 stop:544 length:261 start_codon:yes stop_codon:yes gene_type:complete
MAINTYNTVESGNISLGQGGSAIVTALYEPENAKIVAIFCLEDSDVATTGDNHADLTGNTLKEGWTILGNWKSINVSSGKVLAYIG